MHRILLARILLATVLSLFLCSQAAQATRFSIPVQPKPDDEPASIHNPLYQGNGQSGENPLSEGVNSISVKPVDVWPGSAAELVMNVGDDLPSDLPAAPAGALAFEVSLYDAASGEAIHELAAPLCIYLDIDAWRGDTFDFGTYNPISGQWESMGLARRDGNGQVCGTTNHLSYFYVAAVPEPSSWLLAAMAGAGLLLARRRAK